MNSALSADTATLSALPMPLKIISCGFRTLQTLITWGNKICERRVVADLKPRYSGVACKLGYNPTF